MLRCCTDRSLTRWPRMKTSPAVGISKPAIMRSTVVLPPPLGPSKAISSPSFTEKVTLLTAVVSPNFLVTFFSSMLTGEQVDDLESDSCYQVSTGMPINFLAGHYQLLSSRLLPFEQCLDAQCKQ